MQKETFTHGKRDLYIEQTARETSADLSLYVLRH